MRNFAISVIYDQDPSTCDRLRQSITNLLRSRRLSKTTLIRTTIGKISVAQLRNVLTQKDASWPTPNFMMAERRLLLASDTESTDLAVAINRSIANSVHQDPKLLALTFDDAIRYVCATSGCNRITLKVTDQKVDDKLEERLMGSDIEIVRSSDSGENETAVYAKAAFIIMRGYARLQE